MIDEKLGKAAHAYVGIVQDIKDAERNISRAQTALDNLHRKRQEAALQMREFVGKNITKKAVIVPGGYVVVVEWVSDNNMPAITVYAEGEEIR